MRPHSESAGVTVAVNRTEEDAVRVCVVGEIDMSSAPTFGAALADVIGSCPQRRVELSLAGVRFLDASGVRVLIDAHRTLAEGGRQLVVVAAQPMVCRVLGVTGVLAVLAPAGVENAPAEPARAAPSALDAGGGVRRSDRLGLG